MTPRIAIVAAEFNKELVDKMIDAATAELKAASAEIGQVIRVAGAYELPLMADVYLEQSNINALVVLGYIERGETLHGEVMGHVVHATLVQLQLKHRKPIGMGIVGPGATLDQARVRAEPSARAAVLAAARSCRLLAAIPSLGS